MSRTLYLKQARRLKFNWLQCCSQLTFRYTCVEQGVPWHSGNYRVEIHFKTCANTVNGMARLLRELSSKDLKVQTLFMGNSNAPGTF